MKTPESRLKTGRTTAELCAAAELSDAALALRAEGVVGKAYLTALMEAGHFADAVRFLAHALPIREGVWWAWVCARRAAGDEPAPAVAASLDATKTWIAEPTDTNRRAAMAHAEAVEFSTPAGCAGLAAFFSGGSLGPPEHDPVPPAEFMAAKAVAGCILLASVLQEPDKADEKFRAFLQQGLEVAEKTQLWTPPPAAPR
ncbi:MAG: hypothetical protein OEO21_09355 [Candidatus Krumholzibacteria bacterium]|nr:hypothetical protein [Candidatus Krumholzibacteria bacterium]